MNLSSSLLKLFKDFIHCSVFFSFQADKFGYYTITFVNDKCLSKSDVWYIFSKFGTVACVNGTFDCKKGRVFVSYKEKQGALNALETMLITKEYHLQVRMMWLVVFISCLPVPT